MNVASGKQDADRIWFAHMLRAVAALTVIFKHYCDIFINANSTVVGLAFTQPVTIDSNIFLAKFTLWLQSWHFDGGAYGVALFFLVSGFVIPISMDRIGVDQFLIRRFFRIFPPYAIGLLFVVGVVYIYTSQVGTPFPYTIKDYLINTSLFRDWFWVRSIDGVNWTLELELKFYIFCAFLVWVSNLHNPKTLIIAVLVMFVFVYMTSGTYDFLLGNFFYLYKFVYILSITSAYLSFMLIGTSFYNFYASHWNKRLLIAISSLFLFIFLIEISLSPINGQLTMHIVNYSLALGTFTFCFVFREKLPYSRVLDFLATISYPIYIIHGIVGYILLTVLTSHNVNIYVSIVLVIAFVIIVAYVLHKFVELPSNNLGKYVARSMKHLLADNR